ncbi:MAG: agmatine deiminase family protein [Actinomycetota bacterium]
MTLSRRELLAGAGAGAAALWLVGCGDETPEEVAVGPVDGRWWMPAEEDAHEVTWMCLPRRTDVWGRDLPAVQQTIADIAVTIAAFEPVRILVHPDDLGLARDLMGSDVEQLEAPVDDLWARDTLPLFLVDGSGGLAAGRVRFNGWGDKQVHAGDATLAGVVADILGVELVDPGVVGEGGGIEVDGEGSLLAARSSWVNDNRNPGWTEAEIGDTLVALLGAERMLWVDGIAGQDITDGHIDTLARFTEPGTLIHELPSYVEPGETWYDVAVDTEAALRRFRTLDGEPYELITLRQPAAPRGTGDEFLASYVNYYVCNGGVIIPEFGDEAADAAAAEQIGAAYPGREIVALDIDPVSAGGGGIHCATQQQPAV